MSNPDRHLKKIQLKMLAKCNKLKGINSVLLLAALIYIYLFVCLFSNDNFFSTFAAKRTLQLLLKCDLMLLP